MQTGIIGLPQVGKTTLFRILTKAAADGKGGQATQIGIAKVPEPRLQQLATLYNPKKITYATVQYVDLGGMQKDRMRDALAQLREVDAIAHVIRVFDDPSVPHSEGSIDPLRDAVNLELELLLSELFCDWEYSELAKSRVAAEMPTVGYARKAGGNFIESMTSNGAGVLLQSTGGIP